MAERKVFYLNFATFKEFDARLKPQERFVFNPENRKVGDAFLVAVMNGDNIINDPIIKEKFDKVMSREPNG